jgi:hypothetical protein
VSRHRPSAINRNNPNPCRKDAKPFSVPCEICHPSSFATVIRRRVECELAFFSVKRVVSVPANKNRNKHRTEPNNVSLPPPVSQQSAFRISRGSRVSIPVAANGFRIGYFCYYLVLLLLLLQLFSSFRDLITRCRRRRKGKIVLQPYCRTTASVLLI